MAIVGDDMAGDWPCLLWPVDTACCPKLPDDPDQWTAKHRFAVEMASETLWRLTAGRYGVCGEITRPCRVPCEQQPSWNSPPLDAGYGWMSPALVAGQMVNHPCGICVGPDCSCAPLQQVELGAPVVEVTAVMIDGEQLPPSAYTVHNDRWLVRTDGGTWPDCQYLERPLDEPGTFAVAYWRGRRPPASAARVMGTLVCEYLKQCDGDGDCRLPAGTTRVEREGLSYEIWQPDQPGDAAALLPEVRSWLAMLGLADQRSPASVWSPDFPVVRSDRSWPAIMRMSWSPHPDTPLGITVTVTGVGSTGAVVSWGDGSSDRLIDGQPTEHVYAQAGTYEVTACTPGGRQCQTRSITVKAVMPTVHVYRHADNPWWVLVWIEDTDPEARYRIDWGDGSQEAATLVEKRPEHPRIRHDYTNPGVYEIRVTDLDTHRSVSQQVTCGDIGMLFTYPTSGSDPRLVALWIARHAVWEVDWGTLRSDRGVAGPEGRLVLLYGEDMPAGLHRIVVSEYPQESGYALRRRSVRSIRIPTDWEWGLDVYMLWRDHHDEPGRQTVDVTPREAKRACTIEWGDGEPSTTVEPGATATHTYRVPPPEQGYRLTVTEPGSDEDPERLFSRLLAVPRHVSHPVMSTRTPGAVDLDVAGADGESNADWYWIDWGDGTVAPFGAVGAWFPAHHTYEEQGEYTITVDGPGMPHPVHRRVVVRFYPTPDMRIREYRTEPNERDQPDDPTRRTVEVKIDNREPEHCGGDVRMRWGDATGNTILSEDATHLHRFPETGNASDSYTVIASCLADLTAKTREQVTVPFGSPSTLEMDWRQADPADPATVRAVVTARDPAKTVQISWDDGTGAQQVPPAGYLDHTYSNPSKPDPDWYYPSAGYTDGSESADGFVEIPWPQEARRETDAPG